LWLDFASACGPPFNENAESMGRYSSRNKTTPTSAIDRTAKDFPFGRALRPDCWTKFDVTRIRVLNNILIDCSEQ
jgi:hypothetical protein